MMRLLVIFSFLLAASGVWGQNFRVQIAAYEDSIAAVDFHRQGIPSVFVAVDEVAGMYHYFAGSYATREEAEVMRRAVAAAGYPGARIIDLEEERIRANANCPDSRAAQLFGIDPSQVGNLRTIYFGSGSTELMPQARYELDRMAVRLRAEPALKLNLFGHTDGIGKPQANIELATARARAARNCLIARGVNADRMFLRIFGEADPAAPNQDDEGKDLPNMRKWNRRVVLVLF